MPTAHHIRKLRSNPPERKAETTGPSPNVERARAYLDKSRANARYVAASLGYKRSNYGR